MYLYLTFEEKTILLAECNPNKTERIIGLPKIMRTESLYTNLKGMLQCIEAEDLGGNGRPLLVVNTEHPMFVSLKDEFSDFTSYFISIPQIMEARELALHEACELVQQIILEDIKGFPFTAEDLEELIKICREIKAYVEGEEYFLVVLNETDRAIFADAINGINEKATYSQGYRLYQDNRVNSGAPMETPNSRCYFRVPGPRAIYQAAGDVLVLKPSMLAFYGKEHIEHVKDYKSAVYDASLRGVPVMIDAPISPNEEELYTALCQMMADSFRMPKTDFVLLEEDDEDEDRDPNEALDIDDENAKRIEYELPVGKMYSCHNDKEILDIVDDDEYLLNHGKLDAEIEEYMMMVIKSIGSWNWAFSGNFPHAIGYTEVEMNPNGIIQYFDKPKVITFTEDMVDTLDIQSSALTTYFSQQKGVKVQLRQTLLQNYIKECYKEFGPRVLAEAVIKVARWGNRRPNKLHLAKSEKYFNFNSGTVDSKSGNLEQLELQLVDGREMELFAAINPVEGFKDSTMVMGNDARLLKDFPVGILARTKYVNPKSPEETEQVFKFISLLDLAVTYLTGDDKNKVAGIDLDSEGNFVVNSATETVVELENLTRILEGDMDNTYSMFRTDALKTVVIMLGCNQQKFSGLQSYEYVRRKAVISPSYNKFTEPLLTKIPDFLRSKQLNLADNKDEYLHMALFNIMEEYVTAAAETLAEALGNEEDLRKVNYSIGDLILPNQEALYDMGKSVQGILLSGMLNELKKLIVNRQYVGEMNYCDKEFLSNYEIKMPRLLWAGSEEPMQQMNLTDATNAATTGGAALIKSIEGIADCRKLDITVKKIPLHVGFIYIGQDADGWYGIISSADNGADKQTELPSGGLYKIVYETALYEMDPQHRVKANFGPSVSRIYFDSVETMLRTYNIISGR